MVLPEEDNSKRELDRMKAVERPFRGRDGLRVSRAVDVPPRAMNWRDPNAHLPWAAAQPDGPPKQVVKNYTLNLSNPLTSRSLDAVNHIYEDYLPPSVAGQRMTDRSTVRSREGVYNLVRNFVVGNSDGRMVHFASQGHQSLFSHLKMLEVNPFHSSKDSDNPYRTNPFDQVVVRCGYPIRYHPTGNVSLGRENVSLNIRVYRLRNADLLFQRTSLQAPDVPAWRDVLYYRKVLRDVLLVEPPVSPHFIMMYGYLLCASKVNFDALNANRRDPDRLQRFLLHRERLLESALSGTGEGQVRIVADEYGSLLSGAGVCVVDESGRNVLLARNPETLRYQDFGGKLFSGSPRLDAVRRFKRHLKLNIQQADLRYHVNLPHGKHSYCLFVVRLKSPSLESLVRRFPGLLAVPVRDLSVDSSLLSPRGQRVLQLLQNDPPMGAPLLHLSEDPFLFDVPTSKVPLRQRWLEDSGTSLLVLTESPTHSVTQWSSRKYQLQSASVMRMERHGIYPKEVWLNVYFQIMHAFVVMWKKGFVIRNMSLDSNVFVRDVPKLTNQFWVYSVEGFEFYVPNLGYLVQVDLGGVELDDFGHKVLADFWEDEGVRSATLREAERVLSVSNWAISRLHENVNQPPESVLRALSGFRLSEDHVDNLLVNMPAFYHPRVGTSLQESEQSLVSRTPPRPSELRRGEIVVYDQTFVYFSRETEEEVAEVVSCTESKVCVKELVSFGSLRRFLSRISDTSGRFPLENLLERYVV